MTPHTLKLLRALIHSAALICCFVVLGFAGYFWIDRQFEGEVELSYLEHRTALAESDKAGHEAMAEYLRLEGKRTTVQTEIRRIVIAEWRKCKRGNCK